MASRVDLRDGKIEVDDRQGSVGRLSKTDVLLSRDERDIISKFVTRTKSQVYYFHYDTLSAGWECISGPTGMPRPQASDWPSAQRARGGVAETPIGREPV